MALRNFIYSKQHTLLPTLEQQHYSSGESTPSSRSSNQEPSNMELRHQVLSPRVGRPMMSQENPEFSFSRAMSDKITARDRSNSLVTLNTTKSEKRGDTLGDMTRNFSGDSSAAGSGAKSPLVQRLLQIEQDVHENMIVEKPSPVSLPRGFSSPRSNSMISLQQGQTSESVSIPLAASDQRGPLGTTMSRGSSLTSYGTPISPRLVSAHEKLARAGSSYTQNNMISPLCRDPIHFQQQ